MVEEAEEEAVRVRMAAVAMATAATAPMVGPGTCKHKACVRECMRVASNPEAEGEVEAGVGGGIAPQRL